MATTEQLRENYVEEETSLQRLQRKHILLVSTIYQLIIVGSSGKKCDYLFIEEYG
jgi:hypothetical protein